MLFPSGGDPCRWVQAVLAVGAEPKSPSPAPWKQRTSFSRAVDLGQLISLETLINVSEMREVALNVW